MRFVFEPVPTLPRLAWCARIRAGVDAVAVRHGPWVEARDDCFFEGAWDGPFGEGRLDEAVALSGTGARSTQCGAVFAAASNLHDRLYATRAGDELLVSNSLTFLLVAAGDEPDPVYPYYAGDFVDQVLRGIRRRRRTIPTRRGAVAIHECGNLVGAPDLTVRRSEKRAPPAPADFDGYVRLLEETIERVVQNAGDRGRIQTYAPLATLSQGYDAPAVAALARRRGCTEAFTFAGSAPGEGIPEDGGKAIGAILGMNVTEYSRTGVADPAACFEAEFSVAPPGVDVALASLGERLAGSLLLTGRFGDDVWSRTGKPLLPDLRQHTPAGLGGSTMIEFRLRVGFLNFPPLFTGAQHIAAIRRIASSASMRPWSVGGSYDRPIARRILEEAGVPRELFGREKVAGAVRPLTRVEDLSRASREDFLAFFSERGPSSWTRRKAHLLRGLYRLNLRANRRIARLTGALGRPLHLPPLLSPRYSQRLSATGLFCWGFHRIKDRYRVG